MHSACYSTISIDVWFADVCHEIYLDISCATVEVEMKVPDLSELPEGVLDVLLCCLFMHPRDEHDPSLNRCDIIW